MLAVSCLLLLGILAFGEGLQALSISADSDMQCFPANTTYIVVNCSDPSGIDNSDQFTDACVPLLIAAAARTPAQPPGMLITIYNSDADSISGTINQIMGAFNTLTTGASISTVWVQFRPDGANAQANAATASAFFRALDSVLAIANNNTTPVVLGVVLDDDVFSQAFGLEDMYEELSQPIAMWIPRALGGALRPGQDFDDFATFSGFPADAVRVIVSDQGTCEGSPTMGLVTRDLPSAGFMAFHGASDAAPQVAAGIHARTAAWLGLGVLLAVSAGSLW